MLSISSASASPARSDIKQRVLDRLQTENAKLEAQLLASQAECERLREWKRQQLQVESEWDPQAVGNALGIQWGASIRAGILPAVQTLSAQMAQLTRPVSDEEWKVIVDTVETMTIWSRQDFTNSDGSTPMWNSTLRRLRNLLATRAQSIPPSPAPDAVREKGEEC